MKQLMIRNLKLRSWTLIIYALLLLFFPIYHLLNKDTPLYSIISGPIGLILTMICLIDIGHLFRVNRRLGGSSSYYFFYSLPVSKRDLLNANYMTCILLTFIGALIISLYGYNTDIPYIAYIVGIMVVLPFTLSVIFILINYLTHNDSHIPMIYSYFLNYGLLVVSSIFLVINYLIQIKKIKY